MSKFLLIFFFCFLLSFSFVFAVNISGNESFVYNSSCLPVNDSFVLNLSVDVNESVFLFLLNSSPELSFDFNSSYFTVNESFDLVVPFVVNESSVFENVFYEAIFKVNNSFSNVSIFYTLFVSVLFDESVNTGVNGFVFYVLNGSDSSFNVTSNFLPFEKVYNYRIKGLAGEVINLSCSSWFTCPENITFGSDNLSNFAVTLLVPEVAVGSYFSYVNMSGLNNSFSSVYSVTVLKPTFTFDSYVFTPDCYYVNAAGEKFYTLDCVEDYKAYMDAVSDQSFEFYRDYIFPTCENITNTEYIISGNVEQDFKDAYDLVVSDRDTCYETKSTLLDEKISCASSLGVCNTDLSTCNDDLFDARETSLNVSHSEKMICLGAVDDALVLAKSKRVHGYWVTFFWLSGFCLFVGLVWFFLYYRNSRLIPFN